MNTRLLLLSAIAFLALCSESTAQHGDRNYNVGAHYYPWYYNDFHGGMYLREHLVPVQRPELGEYNDRDKNIVKAHLDWSRYAGIDFWSASWWGPGSREDVTLLGAIFSHPDLGNFKIAIHYETVGRTEEFSDYSAIGPDITYLAKRYFGHPNYLTIDGRPVLIVYAVTPLVHLGTVESTVAAMRAAAEAQGYELYLIGDLTSDVPPDTAPEAALFDAIMPYDVYGPMGATGYAGQEAVDEFLAAQQRWKALAENEGVNYAPGVTPGFNSRAVAPDLNPLSRKLTEQDQFGSLFQALLEGALPLTDPELDHMIFVTSWNEWHEDTQIEPVHSAPPTSVDDSATGDLYTQGFAYEGYSMRYLDILRDFTTPPFTINAGLNDAWYEPATAGQGMLITVLPDAQKMFLAWFTFDVERPPEDIEAIMGDPGHRWLTAQGFYNGDTANLTIYVTQGGVFDSAQPEAITDPEGDGSMTVRFSSCTEGHIDYEIESLGISGAIPITRIGPDNVELCESLSGD